MTETLVSLCPNCESGFRGIRNPVLWSDGRNIPCGHEWHTVEQLELDTAPLVVPDRVEGVTHKERFESFNKLNPWVLEALEQLTVDYLDRGAKRMGIGMLFEVLRWQHGRQTQGEKLKLNNNHRSHYVRLMKERHPEWEDVFETRTQTSE